VLFGALFGVAALTLTPVPVTFSAGAPWWCLWCGEFSLIDIIANVALFAPVGIGLWLIGFAPVAAAVTALAVTAGVEALQLQAIAGRDADLRDILTNSVGAGMGYALAPYLGTLWRPPRRTAGILAGGVAASWIASRFLTGMLLAPSPPAGPWFAQVAPGGVYPSTLQGVVRLPTVNARPIGIGWIGRIEDVTTLWEHGGIVVVAEVTLRSLPARLASAVSVFSESREEAFVLGVDGGDVVFRIRNRAADFRLRSPSVRLHGGIAAGDTAVITGRLHNRRLAVMVGGTTAREVEVPLSAGLGWALLSPLDVRLDQSSARWSALLVAAALMLTAWYLAQAVRPSASALIGAFIGAAGLVMPEIITVAAPTPAFEWLGAVLGLALGFGCAAIFSVGSSRGPVLP